ncbi:unnamed protein product [Blepharisma stoltei]|uniref:C2H2-type domain-containing protein n=1 Tax=Blepharisma stoltei TaxID=1481888 RepID=A0AAU9IED1_9CILI|nr:unnamed protein product [Blepharisma stoltei]
MFSFSISKFLKPDRVVPHDEETYYMTEAEAKELSVGFNQQLKQCSVQIEEFNNRNQSLKEKLLQTSKRNKKMQENTAQKEEELKHMENDLINRKQYLEQLEARLNQSSQDITNENWKEDIEQAKISIENSSYDRLRTNIFSLLNHLKDLEAQKLSLQTENEIINKKITETKEKEYRPLECKNCKSIFIPIQNHDMACSYHPGKLKYYSCRGCGEDAYMNCCLKCKKCSEGCKISHHVA